MNYTKNIVCFANSRKIGGYCVAGKESIPGMPWVRPISHRPTHELSENELTCHNECIPQPLDRIEISFCKPFPLYHQPENHLIDPGVQWVHQGRIRWGEIEKWLDTPQTLWSLGESSTTKLNDRLSMPFGKSLYLVGVDEITLLTGPKSPYPDAKWAVRGQFIWNKNNYMLDVTDPFIEYHYHKMPNGYYIINNPVLCISLSDLWNGFYYKLISAILFEERVDE
ncbi:MAG: hypothetical protein H7839_07130 [Magnetococcus sp. YQC-5]